MQVQKWLGHHKPSFTLDTYVHLLDEDVPGARLSSTRSPHAGRSERTSAGASATVRAQGPAVEVKTTLAWSLQTS